MKFNDSIIQLYLKNQAILTGSDSWLYDQIQVGKHLFEQPDPQRIEVVKELNSRIQNNGNQILFNYETISSLPINTNDTIYLIVGATHGYDCICTQDLQGNTIYIVDLLQFAQYGPEINNMMYVLRSSLTKTILKHNLDTIYPHQSVEGYQNKLKYLAFTHGLCEYLAWGEDIKQYQLSTEKYLAYQEFNLALFHQALKEKSPLLQQKLLIASIHNDYWKRFATISGMFMWEHINQTNRKDAILIAFENGWEKFIKMI